MTAARQSVAVFIHALAAYHYEKYSVYVSTYYVAFMMMTLPMQWNFKHGKVFEILPPTLKLTGHQ